MLIIQQTFSEHQVPVREALRIQREGTLHLFSRAIFPHCKLELNTSITSHNNHFFVVRIFKIYSLNYFQVCNTVFPENVYKWPTGKWRGAHKSSGKCTSVAVISHLLKRLPWERQKITRVEEDVEKRKPIWTVGGNVNWFSQQFDSFSACKWSETVPWM